MRWIVHARSPANSTLKSRVSMVTTATGRESAAPASETTAKKKTVISFIGRRQACNLRKSSKQFLRSILIVQNEAPDEAWIWFKCGGQCPRQASRLRQIATLGNLAHRNGRNLTPDLVRRTRNGTAGFPCPFQS